VGRCDRRRDGRAVDAACGERPEAIFGLGRCGLAGRLRGGVRRLGSGSRASAGRGPEKESQLAEVMLRSRPTRCCACAGDEPKPAGRKTAASTADGACPGKKDEWPTWAQLGHDRGRLKPRSRVYIRKAGGKRAARNSCDATGAQPLRGCQRLDRVGGAASNRSFPSPPLWLRRADD